MRTWQDIEGYFDFADLYEEAVAEAVDGAVFVEIGVWHGRSLVYLADAIRRSGKAIRLCAVDTWATPPIEAFRQALRDCGVEDLVEVIQSDSALAAQLFADGSVDFAFIDADHSYEGVRRDIEAWRAKVRPGGTLAGHDAPRECVARAVRDTLGGFEALKPSSWRVRL